MVSRGASGARDRLLAEAVSSSLLFVVVGGFSSGGMYSMFGNGIILRIRVWSDLIKGNDSWK